MGDGETSAPAPTHWVASSAPTAFTWDYGVARPELRRLYERAKGAQWDVDVDLDWSTSVDPEAVVLADSAAHGGSMGATSGTWFVGTPVAAWGRAEWLAYGVESRRWMLSQFLHGEQGALVCTAKIVQASPSIDAKAFAATQVFDEARHVEAFARYVDAKLGGPYPVNPHLRSLLDDVVADSRWDVTYLGMQILVEGLALGAFGFMQQTTTEPLLASLLTRVMADEARHVAFGVLSLQELYAGLGAAELRERQELTLDACLRMRDRLLQQEVWEQLGIDPEVVTPRLRTDPSRLQFQRLLFGRIVPACGRLGLLDAGDGWLRARLDQHGLLAETDAAAGAVTGLDGRCDPAFAAVADVLADDLAHGGQLGAALVVLADGRPVVDVWGGVADGRDGRPWAEGTVAMGFSVAKAAVAALCCRLAQEGVVDLDEPLVARWPEFGVHGKEHVTLRWVLSHRAALPAVRVPLEPQDLVAGRPIVHALAAEVPWWEPGTDAGYHPITFGHLVGEALRRTTGASLGALLATHVAGPLGLDLWIGLPEAVRPRLARLEQAEPTADHDDHDDHDEHDEPEVLPGGEMAELAFANPPMAAAAWNSPALLRAEVPAVNAVGTARAWAQLAAACGAGGATALLAPAWVDAARSTEHRGDDRVQPGTELHVGLGFRLPTAARPLLGPGSFGHTGTGGAVVVAAPEARVAVAFLPNRVQLGVHEDRLRDRLLVVLRALL